MNEFFISDYHLNHTRMADMRGFSSYEEMNEHIIATHNSVITEKDNVYYEGDFNFRGDPNILLDRLNGRFYFIRGNHDQKIIKHKKIVHWVDGYYDIKLHDQKITLCHYPMLTWNCSHYGAWCLTGHHHSTIIEDKFPMLGKHMTVSWEALKGIPISFDEVKKYMGNRHNNWDFIGEKYEEQ